jgi:hypothetical protein
MECHEYCALFPEMTDEEFADFKADIAANGAVRSDLYVSWQGRRRSAPIPGCSELQIAPKFREWVGEGSLLGHETSKNLPRLMGGEEPTCLDLDGEEDGKSGYTGSRPSTDRMWLR